MPMPLPNLDDRSYDDLVAEARALIPTIAPRWTNHNPTDPGITIVELLAWLSEMLLYQLNEVPPASTVAFLELLNGPGWAPPPAAPGEVEPALAQAVRETVLGLRERYRAASADDYEFLALRRWPPEGLAGAPRLRRARCVSRRNLALAKAAGRAAEAPGHVSLVIIPDAPGETPAPGAELCAQIAAFLEERRMLTVQHHVVGPSYVAVAVAAELILRDDALPGPALRQAHAALRAYYHPLTGGPERDGWPFGRGVYAAEVYALLDDLPLVDYIAGVSLRAAGGPAPQVELAPHELVAIDPGGVAAVDRNGDRYLLRGDELVEAGAARRHGEEDDDD